MSASRLAAWIFGLAVGTAWLASAAGVGRTPPVVRTSSTSPINAELAALATDVQTQAARLKDRLSHAPEPSPQQRNPFAFAERRRSAARPSEPLPVPEPIAAAVPMMPAEPVLALIGIAEMPGRSGPVRTAMITRNGAELLMVTTGQSVMGRYEVTQVGLDAVQLKDTASGEIRTLVLR